MPLRLLSAWFKTTRSRVNVLARQEVRFRSCEERDIAISPLADFVNSRCSSRVSFNALFYVALAITRCSNNSLTRDGDSLSPTAASRAASVTDASCIIRDPRRSRALARRSLRRAPAVDNSRHSVARLMKRVHLRASRYKGPRGFHAWGRAKQLSRGDRAGIYSSPRCISPPRLSFLAERVARIARPCAP